MHRLFEDAVVVGDGPRARTVPLHDLARPGFLALPHIDLDDGRPLRAAAFDAWAVAVRSAAATGRGLETSYRPVRPVVTWLAIVGAGIVAAAAAWLLAAWATRPSPAVSVEPTTVQSFATVLGVAAVLALFVAGALGLARAWLFRRGSYVGLDDRGIRVGHGADTEPFAVVAAAGFHPWLRCTRIAFADGRPPLFVPAEPGPLRRLDLVLAAMHPPLRAAAA